ncbi:NAD(P)/FAD-dependent oxidoreductase [Myceligenerans pegani]|uniref:FAD-binding oxidoreductase n=1 Tax=Myceligenerans pegani TaxID=2776917 RepID=A0ABR9MWS2_9MICO|nr:FAD-binding oxidoreductase [Myceligenerans sp. TRM 65318]MBE1875840.1 FAD-binding oxidoreductase [Myceligenerans sp. TRM 65318]MBE3018111.1 FAD-binding oxidoreductase [Myceligenerans sp. TRM 65318]
MTTDHAQRTGNSPTDRTPLPGDVDVAICGAGPIGAATAHFLARRHPGLRVALLTDHAAAPPDGSTADADPEHHATYRYSGGSIRWAWDDAVKREMTNETAGFVRALLSDGVELDALENTYHLLHTGELIPALNLSAARLVDHLVDTARADGVAWHPGTTVTGVRPGDDGGHVVETSRGDVRARQVLVALGARTPQLVPAHDTEAEKRQLFVLDLPVTDARERLPHTIVPVGKGFAYVLVKRTDGGVRVVVGQEDIVEDDDTGGPVDYWEELLDSGVGDVLPWLRDAGVERILWGVDSAHKKLAVTEPTPGLLAANCGSAVRSSAWIGRTLAARLAAGRG